MTLSPRCHAPITYPYPGRTDNRCANRTRHPSGLCRHHRTTGEPRK